MSVNLNPPPERDFPAARLEQRRKQLAPWLEAEQRRPPVRALHRRRWTVVAIAATAAAAVAIGVTVLLPGAKERLSSAGQYIHPLPRVSIRTQGGRQLASLVLRRAARTAAQRPPTAPVSGEFIYTKTEAVYETVVGGRNGPTAIALRPETIESWVLPNGRGHYEESEGHMVFPTAADAAYFHANYPSHLVNAHTGVQYFGKGPPNYRTVSRLPTDPAQLRKAIENRTAQPGPPGNSETFGIIGALLRWTAAPPAVRSALYTVVSHIPGVVLLGSTKDQLGRPGIGVAYDGHGVRSELIFDPRTSGLLAEQTVVLERSQSYPFPPGTVTDWAAYIATGIVHSNTATTSAKP